MVVPFTEHWRGKEDKDNNDNNSVFLEMMFFTDIPTVRILIQDRNLISHLTSAWLKRNNQLTFSFNFSSSATSISLTMQFDMVWPTEGIMGSYYFRVIDVCFQCPWSTDPAWIVSSVPFFSPRWWGCNHNIFHFLIYMIPISWELIRLFILPPIDPHTPLLSLGKPCLSFRSQLTYPWDTFPHSVQPKLCSLIVS